MTRDVVLCLLFDHCDRGHRQNCSRTTSELFAQLAAQLAHLSPPFRCDRPLLSGEEIMYLHPVDLPLRVSGL